MPGQMGYIVRIEPYFEGFRLTQRIPSLCNSVDEYVCLYKKTECGMVRPGDNLFPEDLITRQPHPYHRYILPKGVQVQKGGTLNRCVEIKGKEIALFVPLMEASSLQDQKGIDAKQGGMKDGKVSRH